MSFQPPSPSHPAWTHPTNHLEPGLAFLSPATIPSILAPIAYSSRTFTTSPTSLESKRKITARQKKQKNLASRAERTRQDVHDLVDPVMGDLRGESKSGGFFARQAKGKSSANSNSASSTDDSSSGKYPNSLLNKVILDRTSIWFSQPPQYPPTYPSSTHTFPSPIHPTHYSQSLTSPPDIALITQHLPETYLTSTPAAQAIRQGQTPTSAQAQSHEDKTQGEAKMSEQVMRVLDLRNADARGIRKENVRRIVEVFGGDLNTSDNSDSPTTDLPRMNTGHPTVTSAILTHRIHLLSTHLAQNPRDVHNKKHLRQLVHDRAKILAYYKRRVGRRGGEGEGAYLGLLDKLGLDRRAVEGELIVR